VDALLLDGRVRDHHIRFLEDHSFLYLVLGNCPLGTDVPQVRINVEGLGYEITKELLCAGRRPVWFDADPSKADQWYVDLERFRGYSNAIKEYAPGGSMHLCPIEPDKVAQTAAMLCRSGLTNAAIVVDHWASAMLPAALAMHSPNPQELLIVPVPARSLCQALSGPNIVTWSKHVEADEVAEQALGNLVPLVEGKSGQLHSVSLEMKCKFIAVDQAPRMELTTSWEQKDAFSAEEYGSGRTWRHQASASSKSELPRKITEQVNALS
jgi:DNA-binding LacI/PurR family transcriptional regulator